MKVRALANISGPFGKKASGAEFEVSAELGTELVGRRLVESLEPVKAPKAKPAGGAESALE